MKKLLTEPLFHFLLAGLGLFLVYAALERPEGGVGREVVVTPEVRASVAAGFERVWGRAPTAEEAEKALEAWIREEMLYSEGVALGLDERDPVLRGRIAQKMLMVAEASARSVPEATELETFFSENRERYRSMPRYTLAQVFFSAEQSSAATPDRIARALKALEGGAEPGSIGDSTLLPSSLDAAVATYLEGVFGREFVAALADLPTGRWVGPVSSTFGQHLVFLQSRSGGEPPALEAVKEQVLQDWVAAQKAKAREDYLAALRESYRVSEPAVES